MVCLLRKRMSVKPRTLLSFLASTAITACFLGGGNSATSDGGIAPDGGGPPVLPFQADPANVYVAKVKNILVGLPPTDQELSTVEQDPTALRGLVQGWMTTPEYTTKMMRFFELAFEQTQITSDDVQLMLAPKRLGIDPDVIPLFTQNVEESFARTMLMLDAANLPFTQAMTTNQFAMTTALKELYGYFDAWQVNDTELDQNNNKTPAYVDRVPAMFPNGQLVYVTAAKIPLSESLDPTDSVHYMHFTNANVASQTGACKIDPITYPVSSFALHYVLTGSFDEYNVGNTHCSGSAGSLATTSSLTSADFADWQLTTIQPAAPNQATTAYWNLPALRTATSLTYQIPRVGFFSTPAFFANWATNASNEMRVTLNQTLIVATGAQVDGTDTTQFPQNPPGLDSAHATGVCLGCHDSLDPSRSILAATYSWSYHNQDDPTFTGTPGLFAFQGVVKNVSTVQDLGAILASHPLMPSAWVQKLCYYVNSAPCETTDPEFQRIVGLFQSSSYSWSSLVLELVTSPLTTNATATQTTTDEGETIAVSRRDHLCASLNARLGFSDVCGLDALQPDTFTSTMNQIASGLPSDGYGRGAPVPVLPNAPSLFYRAATEDICEAVSQQVIDVAASKQIPGVKQWSSASDASVSSAINDFVTIVMGLPSTDPRNAQAITLLTSHYQAAKTQSSSATSALQSTFAAACISPSAVSIGM